MDKSYITFKVYSTSEDNPIGVEVKLDDDTVYNNNLLIGPEIVQIVLPDDQDDHSLKITLKNKTANHTQLDSAGNIVQDANLVIDNITFDDVAAGYDILQLATYTHDCNGTDQSKDYKFYGEMGCNGTVELKFTTPVYLWLLENS